MSTPIVKSGLDKECFLKFQIFYHFIYCIIREEDCGLFSHDFRNWHSLSASARTQYIIIICYYTIYPPVIKRDNWKSARNGGFKRKITYKYL